MVDPTATTESLLHPPARTSCLPNQNPFEAVYTRPELMKIYTGIGKVLPADMVDQVFVIAKERSNLRVSDESMSLKEFQDILNRLLIQ